jgi:hypothetical protein
MVEGHVCGGILPQKIFVVFRQLHGQIKCCLMNAAYMNSSDSVEVFSFFQVVQTQNHGTYYSNIMYVQEVS